MMILWLKALYGFILLGFVIYLGIGQREYSWVLITSLVFTSAKIEERWLQWKVAVFPKGFGHTLFSVATTYVSQLLVVTIFYFLGFGVASFAGVNPAVDEVLQVFLRWWLLVLVLGRVIHHLPSGVVVDDKHSRVEKVNGRRRGNVRPVWKRNAPRHVRPGEIGRVWFRGNPWPAGHRLERFFWGASLDPESGLSFALGFQTADYYEEDDPDVDEDHDEELSDWEARASWCNYHQCSLESQGCDTSSRTLYRSPETMVGAVQPGATWDDVLVLTAEPLGDSVSEVEDFADLKFGIYLLGHDAVGNHRIEFKRQGHGFYTIDWRANIALIYGGDERLAYDLHARIPQAVLETILVPKEMTEAVARELLEEYVPEHALYEYVSDGKEGPRFV